MSENAKFDQLDGPAPMQIALSTNQDDDSTLRFSPKVSSTDVIATIVLVKVRETL